MERASVRTRSGAKKRADGGVGVDANGRGEGGGDERERGDEWPPEGGTRPSGMRRSLRVVIFVVRACCFGDAGRRSFSHSLPLVLSLAVTYIRSMSNRFSLALRVFFIFFSLSLSRCAPLHERRCVSASRRSRFLVRTGHEPRTLSRSSINQ